MFVEKIRNDMAIAQKEKNQLDVEALSDILEVLTNTASLKKCALTDLTDVEVLATLKKDRKMSLLFEKEYTTKQTELGRFMHRKIEILNQYLE